MKPGKCVCGHPAHFWSARLEHGFCSDKCYEQTQRGTDPEQAHIITTRKKFRVEYELKKKWISEPLCDSQEAADKLEADCARKKGVTSTRIVTVGGESFFEQAGIRFTVDAESLEKTLGAGPFSGRGSCLDHLMDSDLVNLAMANGLPVDPYNRTLLCSPLRGIIQIVWYRDLERHSSEHLEIGQTQRIAEYKRLLATTAVTPENGDARATKRQPRAWAAGYKAAPGKHDVDTGREKQVLDVVRDLGEASLAQIVKAAEGKVKTKQDLTKIVHRFLTKLVSKGAILEVK